ncbi:sodium/substrate symporter small subunit [Comamonadaceae bacterium PP-2]
MRSLTAARLGLLALWMAGSWAVPWFARDLDFVVRGWPFYLWWAAQGSILFSIALCALSVWLIGRFDDETEED